MAPRTSLPRIVVNAKAYPQAMGRSAIALARACEAEARRAKEAVALALPATELHRVAALRLRHVTAWGQHVEPAPPGAATGTVNAELLVAAGAKATLLNHAERKVGATTLRDTLARLHAVGFPALVCADSVAEARQAARLGPLAIAIEPPELIGGDVSVTSADPAIVRDAVRAVHRIAPGMPVLCGAGVKTDADVAAALDLGAHGVLLASGVVKAAAPAQALRGLLAGLSSVAGAP